MQNTTETEKIGVADELSDVADAAFAAMSNGDAGLSDVDVNAVRPPINGSGQKMDTGKLHFLTVPAYLNGNQGIPSTRASKPKYSGLSGDGWRFVQNAGAPHSNLRRREMAGYKKIGKDVQINYSSHSIDTDVPRGSLRLVAFSPDPSGKRQLKGTFTKIDPKYAALHESYESIGDAVGNNDFRTFRTYRIPNGMERIAVPMPAMYDAHGRQVDYMIK